MTFGWQYGRHSFLSHKEVTQTYDLWEAEAEYQRELAFDHPLVELWPLDWHGPSGTTIETRLAPISSESWTYLSKHQATWDSKAPRPAESSHYGTSSADDMLLNSAVSPKRLLLFLLTSSVTISIIVYQSPHTQSHPHRVVSVDIPLLKVSLISLGPQNRHWESVNQSSDHLFALIEVVGTNPGRIG